MNFARVILLALIFGCAVPGLHAQKKDKDRNEKAVAEASNHKGKKGDEQKKPVLKNPEDTKSKADANARPEFVLKAQMESERLATAYGIEDKESQKKLLKACRKYYRAKELLEKEYGSSENTKRSKKQQKDLEQRARILEKEYGRELRRILPES